MKTNEGGGFIKRCFSFLLTAILFLTIIPWASAAMGSEVQPMWTYVTSVAGKIDISANGTATISATGTADRKGVTKVTVTASLQQYNAGKWKEVKSWAATNDGTAVELTQKSWNVNHGYSYRVVVTAKAYSGTTLLEQGSSTENYGYFA